MNDSKQQNRFTLDPLEPRILLSADPIAEGLAGIASPVNSPLLDAVENIQVDEDQVGPFSAQEDSLSYHADNDVASLNALPDVDLLDFKDDQDEADNVLPDPVDELVEDPQDFSDEFDTGILPDQAYQEDDSTSNSHPEILDLDAEVSGQDLAATSHDSHADTADELITLQHAANPPPINSFGVSSSQINTFLASVKAATGQAVDIALAAGQGLIDGLDGLANWLNELKALEEFIAPLPLVDKTLSELLDVATFIQDNFVTPLEALDFSSADSTDVTDALDAALDAALGDGDYVSDMSVPDELRFEIDFRFEKSTMLDLGFGDAADALGLNFDTEVEFKAFFEVEFEIGFDTDITLSPDNAFFIEFDATAGDIFNVGGEVNADPLNADFDLGFVDAAIVNGSLNMNAELNVTLPGLADNKATLNEIVNTSLTTNLLEVSPDSSFDINLPVQATLAGFESGIIGDNELAEIVVSGITGVNLFTNPSFDVDVNNAILKDFTNIKPGDVVGMLQGLGSQLDALSEVLEVTDGIPFLGEAVSSVADFQAMLNELTDGLFDAAVNALHEVDLSKFSVNGAIQLAYVEINTVTGIAEDKTASIDLLAADATDLSSMLAAINAELAAEVGADKIQAVIEEGQLVIKAIDSAITGFSFTSVSQVLTDALGLETSMFSLPLYEFTTIQGLEQLLNDSGLLGDLLGANYDQATNSILFTLNMEKMFDSNLLLNFNESVDLGIGELVLAGSAAANFDVNAGFELTAGIDISILAGSTLVSDLNGGVGVHVNTTGVGDIAFQFADGFTDTVDLSSFDTDSNGVIDAADTAVTLQQLINEIIEQTEISPTEPRLAIGVDGARGTLTFQDQTAGTSDFIMQAVSVSGEPASGAIVDLGIVLFGIGNDDGEIQGASILDRIFIDEGSSISADITVSADGINLTGALGFLEIGIENGSLSPTTIDASVSLQDPGGPADGRIFLDELASRGVDGEDLFFLAAVSPAFNITGGTLTLPIVFPDADSFGFDTDLMSDLPSIVIPFVEDISTGPGGLDVTRLIPDTDNISFGSAALEGLLENFQNMSIGQLLELVVQIGQSIANDFDLFNQDLPLIDASINDLINFVSDGIDSFLDTGFGNEIKTLKGKLEGFLTTNLDIVDGNFDPTTDLGTALAALEQIPGDDPGITLADEFFAALNGLLAGIDLLPEQFNLLTAENPTQLIAAFHSFLLMAKKVDDADLANNIGTVQADAFKAAVNGFIDDAREFVPSSDTILRVVFDAMGFELPEIADVLADLAANPDTAITVIETLITDTIDAALAGIVSELQDFEDNLPPNVPSIQDAIDALGDADQIVNRVESLLSDITNIGVMDIVRLFGLSNDLVIKVNTAIDVVNTALTDPDLAAGALKDNLQAQFDSLVADVRDEITDTVLAAVQQAFGGELFTFRFDSDNNLLLSLHFEADAFELTNTDNVFDLNFDLFGPSDPLPLNFETQIAGEVSLGGTLELGFGLNLSNPSDPGFFLQTTSMAELALRMDIEGFAELSIFALSASLGNPAGPPDFATITLGNDDGGMVGTDPATLLLSIDPAADTDSDGLIPLSDLSLSTFVLALDAFLDVEMPVYTNGTAVEAADGTVEVLGAVAPILDFSGSQSFTIAVNGFDPVTVTVPQGTDGPDNDEYTTVGALADAIDTALAAANFTDMGIFNDGNLGQLFDAQVQGSVLKIIATDDQVTTMQLGGTGLATLGFSGSTSNSVSPVTIGAEVAITDFDADGFSFMIDSLTQAEVNAILSSFTELNLANILAAVESILQLLESGLGSDFLDDIPIISDAADLIGEAVGFLNDGFDTLKGLLESIPNTVIDLGQWVEDQINSALGGLLNDELAQLVSIDDVRFSLDEFTSEIDTSLFTAAEEAIALLTNPDLTVEFDLGFNFHRMLETDFDLGFDAFLFEVMSSGGVDVIFDAAVDFTLGLGLLKGPYLKFDDTAGTNEIEASLAVEVTEDTEISARLFFLELIATPKVGTEHAGEPNESVYDGVNFDATIGVDLGTGEITDFADDLMFDLSFATELNIDLLIEAGVAGTDDTLPNLEVFMNTDWMLTIDENGVTSGPPTLKFNDLSLDLGEFFERTFGPLLDQLEPFTSPLEPIFDLLEVEIPVISDLAKLLGQDPITFGSAIELLGSGFDSVRVFLNIANTVDEILDLITAVGDTGKINFGDMDFSGIDVTDAGAKDTLTDALATVTTTAGQIAGEISNASTAGAELVTKSESSAGFDTSGGLGISFDLFDDPSLIFNVLLGETAPLISWDIPRLAAEFSFGATFGPIIPPIPLFANINLSTEIFADLSVGFDTRGLQTGSFFNGFHFDDLDENGVDILELGLAIEASAGASLSIVVASAGVNGGVRAEIGANWHDNDGDGNVYLDELALNFSRGIQCVFDFEGALSAFFDAFVKIGFDTPFGFVTLFSEVLNLLDVVLLDFSISCPPLPPPLPAELSGNEIQLNIGDRAENRQPGATDGEDSVLVIGEMDRNGDGIIESLQDLNNNKVIEESEVMAAEDLDGDGEISSNVLGVLGYGQFVLFTDNYEGNTETQAAIRQVTEIQLPQNTVIVGNGGAEDDQIIVDASVIFDTMLTGGLGNDVIHGGSGDDKIWGDNEDDTGSGEDELLGGLGNDEIHGGAGNDSIKGNAGSDMIFADEGDDVVHGEDGINADRNSTPGDEDLELVGLLNAIISGDPNNDKIGPTPGFTQLSTPTYDDEIWAGTGADDLRGDFGVDNIRGEGGNDKIVGGFGNDILSGGTETDLIEGNQGSDTIWGDGRDGSGSGDDILFGEGSGVEVGQGGNDTIFGGAGNDTIRDAFNSEESAPEDRVEEGDDNFYGGDDDDLLVTGVGNDRAFGGKGNDEIETDGGNDYIEGGAGTDDITAGTGQDLIIGGSSPYAMLFNDNYQAITNTYTGPTNDGFGTDSDIGDVQGPASNEFMGTDSADTIDAGADDDIVLADNGAFYTDTSTISTQTRPVNLVRVTTFAAGGQGIDEVFGGTGEDIIFGGGLGDTLFGDSVGGEANDIIVGDQGFMTAVVLISGQSGLAPSSGNDKIYGRGGVDIGIGGGGNDIIHGDSENDVLAGDYVELKLRDVDGFVQQGGNVEVMRMTSIDTGDGGNDFIYGSLGADIAIGGIGNDVILGGGTTDTSSPNNPGGDILLGDNGVVVLNDDTGTTGEDWDIFTTAPDDSGEDIIVGSSRPDIIIGGGEDDFLLGLSDSDVVLGDNGKVVRATETEIEEIFTIDEDKGGEDDIFGDADNDLLIGGFADDDIFGEEGQDVILGDNGRVELEPFAGDVVIQDNAVTFVETTDLIAATGGEDVIEGNDGADIIAGGVKGDNIHGNEADDIILGDNAELDWQYDFTTDPFFLEAADTDLNTLDIITAQLPVAHPGGRDLMFGDDGNDVMFGGEDLDTMYGDDGDLEAATTSGDSDVMFGDHGRIYPQKSALPDFPSQNFFAIDTGDSDNGEGDKMWGEEGDDVMLGQQGDDRMWGGTGDDDMIGGHNVAGGYDELTTPAIVATLNPPVNDLMDGGSGDDAMAGDNTIIWRRGDDLSPRFRELTADAIYTTSLDGSATITTNVGADNQSDPDDAVGRDIQLLDHSDAVESDSQGRFGADVMAGGADSDVMFGQLADDLMQGDGSIDTADDGLDQFITRSIGVTDSGSNPDTDETLYFNIPEASTDDDDYMEGNGGSDLMFGGLGQDDMIGGSSELFGLDDTNAALLALIGEQLRPDGSDTIFGGAGAPTRLVRNDFVGSTDTDMGTDVGIGAVPTDDDPSIALEDRHSRDADFIMGDNANVYRLVDSSSDEFLEFNYDQDSTFEDRGDERIVVRGMEQLDYTLGGADFNGGTYDLVTGVANTDNGLADLILGESGDDYIFGMTGSDVIFGNSDDDDVVGGYGNDWISGGTGQDGVLGDDGLLLTSRNSTDGEPLYGIIGLLDSDPRPKYSDGTVLNEEVSTPGNIQFAIINVEGDLKKSVDIVPFSYDPNWLALDDEFPDNADNTPFADDIIFGGLDDDFLHGASGDDAISGAEALEAAYIPIFDNGGNLTGVLDLGYDAFVNLSNPESINPGDSISNPNPGDALAFNPIDLDGQHLNNRFRAGEFFLYDEYDPLRKIQLDNNGNLWKPGNTDIPVDGPLEFLLNFDKLEGLWRAGGQTPGNQNQSVEFDPVNDDGKDAVFGSVGNDWLVGGTGRDNAYGGWGNDLINADDDHDTNSDQNDEPDTHPDYEDRAYGGAGRDVLIANTGGDRLIDWVGEYNSYLVPFAPFGMATVSRTLQPFLPEFLYALSAGDGADPTRFRDANGGAEPPPPTQNKPNPGRNGEPHGELGLVLQKDFAWQDQTGAPADPQAGNIPGGPRDVLRSASFNGLQGNQSAEGFFIDSGNWTVTNAKYQVEPEFLGGDALSVFNVDKYIPKYFELLAILNPVKPTGGFKANAYLVFDYQSDTDFKFAGINVSTNKLEIGHRTETEWVVDVQGSVQGSLKSNTDYNVFLSVNGSAVTLIVDNDETLSYAFDPRIDEDGFVHFANEGMVGLGANNAKASIDNLVVQRLAPIVTYTETADFDDGTTADLFLPPATGTWSVVNQRYEGTVDASGSAINVTDVLVSPASVIILTSTLSVAGEGGFVFDQYDSENFKFVTISSDTITIGHHTSKGWFVDATDSVAIVSGTDYTLGLTIQGTTVSVTVDDQPAISHVFNALATDGNFGLLSRAGTTSFDTVTVQTDDPDLGGQALMAFGPPTASTEIIEPLTLAELNPIIEEAIQRWSLSGLVDDASLRQLNDVNFQITDLEGLMLGKATDTTAFIDNTAAGHGWFIDATPWDDSEFDIDDPVNNAMVASTGEANGRMDLLTAVMHELGHILGHGHNDSYDLMNSTLETGKRYFTITNEGD